MSFKKDMPFYSKAKVSAAILALAIMTGCQTNGTTKQNEETTDNTIKQETQKTAQPLQENSQTENYSGKL